VNKAARQLILWPLAAYGAVAVTGEVWRRIVASHDPTRMPAVVMQQLSDEMRATRDSAVFVVPVTWRPWWTPVPVAGVIATTVSRRVVYIGTWPTILAPPRAAAEPAPTEEWSVPFDSTAFAVNRSVLTGRRTLAIAARGRRHRFDVAGLDRPAAEAMTTVLVRWQQDRRVAAEHDRIVREEAAELAREPVYHAVRPGESLTSIAAHYAMTVDSLARINHLNSDHIRVGGRLLIKPAG
jgi:hypothetical protein